jgi:membrane protease YdiL (CAAX protease family)
MEINKKMSNDLINAKADKNMLLPVAWVVTLLISLLPDILLRELGGGSPGWLYWAKVGLIAAVLLLSLLWKHLRLLAVFFAVLLIVYVLEEGVSFLLQRLNYIAWLDRAPAFVREVGSVQIQRGSVAILLVPLMWLLMGSFQRFFLVRGRLDAAAQPIPWILTRPPKWNILGPAIAGAMCLGLVVFVFAFGSLPSSLALKGVLPLLPFVLLFALVNSFGEEMLYRAPWLGALESPVGGVQALLITAVYFGLAHFYGVPYGVLGVILAFIPGWLMGKSMLETRGFTWAWFIHFWMDVVIFFFIALGSVRAGG